MKDPRNEEPNKLMGIAAIFQNIPKAVWYAALVLFLLFLGLVCWFLRSHFETVIMVLFYTGASIAGLGVIRHASGQLRGIFGDAHDMTMMVIEKRKGLKMLDGMDVKLSREQERLAIDRYMPRAMELAMEAGKNITYTAKEIRIEDWKSNIHMFPQNNGKVEQIAGPDYLPDAFKFSDMLDSGFRPSKEGILLAKKEDVLLCPTGEGLCHTTFTGNTDAGKTNDSRLILIQLLYLREVVFICDKNYQSQRVDSKNPGVMYDYRPIERLLAHEPITESKDTLNFLLFALQELDRRRALRRYEPVSFPNWYLFIDELPAFCAEESDIMKQVGRIVREARQYGLFFIGAAQDVLLNTLGGDNGAVRKNFLTNFYGGGDATTAKMMLNIGPGESIDENGLGRMGVKYIRAKGAGIERVKARVPLSDDRSTHLLLGDIQPFVQVDVPVIEAPSDSRLEAVYTACQELIEQGVRPSARKVEDITGIDRDTANKLMNVLVKQNRLVR